MDGLVITAKVVKPILNWNRKILHEIGDTVVVENWSEVLRTCTVLDKDGAGRKIGIPIEWLEKATTNE